LVVTLPRPDIVVADPLKSLTEIFELPLSGEYDTRGPGNPDLISPDDVALINRTMGARSSYSRWNRLFKRGTLPGLRAINPQIDLFLTPDREWTGLHVVENLASVFASVIGKGIGIAVATKVLHLKRPRLIPVCDSYVLRLMGIPGQNAGSGVALVESLRSLRARWTPPLQQLQRSLRNRGYDRTLVRIADAVMWSALDAERSRMSPSVDRAR
jgi:Family of unknown function (DUF6308)